MASSSKEVVPVEEEKKKVTLKSGDGEVFEVEVAVAMQAASIKRMIDDNCFEGCIPLQNVSGPVLAKVLEFCCKHSELVPEPDEWRYEPCIAELNKFDEEFVRVEQNFLFDLIMAANYLEVKSLLDLTCQTVANMMKGKSPEEIREVFHIQNDYTPEEEEEVRRENQWAFD